MDDGKPEPVRPAPPSLRLALRRARIEGAEHNQAVADLREAEIARLSALEESIRPVLDQAPADADMFDAGIVHGERPRLFIDMIGFVEMGHDRRVYRLMQDTRHGRVVIAESERIDTMTAAVANYVARRLIERERALASDWRGNEAAPSSAQVSVRARALVRGIDAPANDETGAPSRPAAREAKPGRWSAMLWSAFTFLLLLLGSMTLCVLVALAAYALWSEAGRAFLAAHFGSPPH